jgi:hypothetical protein
VPERQLLGATPGRQAGLGFTPLDNAFAAVDDVPAPQASCDRLGPAQIEALLRKWLAIRPHPFSAGDRAAGYRHHPSILQAEFSLTQRWTGPCPAGCSSSR